jgi:hypothetical protein
MSQENAIDQDPEIRAIGEVYASLKNLDMEAQTRVVTFVAAKLQLELFSKPKPQSATYKREEFDDEITSSDSDGQESKNIDSEDDNDGISPVAKKWMTRNDLTSNKLSAIFSLGIDDIDLVAKTVPGKSKRERMGNVMLLKGVAAYLTSGISRFTHEQLREALTHYDAFDNTNFSKLLKSFATEVSGNKSSGYVLTARGLTNATSLLKDIS